MKRTFGATLLAVAGAIGACLPTTSATAQDKPKADFVYVDRSDISTLDLNRMVWTQDLRLSDALYEGLYQVEPKTQATFPGTADKITNSDDKKTWTLHIRDEAKWSNGDKVTSGDYLFAWQRMLREPGDYTYLLHYISGAEAYENAYAKEPKSADFQAVGIKAPDDQTLIVTLNNPVPFFPDLCAFAPFFPLNAKAMEPFRIEEPSGKVRYDEKYTGPGKLVSNGPYKLVSREMKVGVRLEKNEFYWDKANVKSNSIQSVVAEDPLVAMRKYDAGEVDWLADPNSALAASLRKQGREDLHVHQSNGTYYYSFNLLPKLSGDRMNPMLDLRVRKALSMAFDKKPIVETITRLGEPISTTYIPPDLFPNYKSPAGYGFDIKAARKLMKEAGYGPGKDFPKLKLLYNNEGDHRIIGEYVAKQWKDNLAIQIELDGVEINEFRQRLHTKKYDIARGSWFGDYNDISTFTDKYLSVSDNNDSAWISPEYDGLCKQAAAEADEAKRTELLSQAEKLFVDDAAIVPIYTYTTRWMYKPNVTGMYMSTRNHVLFKYVSAGR